jgi:hypothetical protein
VVLNHFNLYSTALKQGKLTKYAVEISQQNQVGPLVEINCNETTSVMYGSLMSRTRYTKYSCFENFLTLEHFLDLIPCL